LEPAPSIDASVAERNLAVVLVWARRAFGVVWHAHAGLGDRVAERVVARGCLSGDSANPRPRGAAFREAAERDIAEVVGGAAVVVLVEEAPGTRVAGGAHAVEFTGGATGAPNLGDTWRRPSVRTAATD